MCLPYNIDRKKNKGNLSLLIFCKLGFKDKKITCCAYLFWSKCIEIVDILVC